jgi:hypothetical protein
LIHIYNIKLSIEKIDFKEFTPGGQLYPKKQKIRVENLNKDVHSNKVFSTPSENGYLLDLAADFKIPRNNDNRSV